METLPAVLTVAGSYAGYLLVWRRVRVAHGRRSGPEPGALARFDHVALAAELAPLLAADDTDATGPLIVGAPAGPLGALPEAWAGAPWSHAAPGRLLEARDLLVAGLPEKAAAAAASGPPAAVRSLLAWAFLQALFGGQLARAAEVARQLQAIDSGAAHRLCARLDAVRAELAETPAALEAACASGQRHLRRARRAGGQGAPGAAVDGAVPDGQGAGDGMPVEPGPAEAGLAAHFEILRLSFWDLELRELAARRHLRRALARHPQAPILHLVRAHLAAVLGDGAGATDHLARALYYARCDRFYARPIAGSAYVARVRPALAAEARDLLGAPRQTHD